jgi:hypothetical protein
MLLSGQEIVMSGLVCMLYLDKSRSVKGFGRGMQPTLQLIVQQTRSFCQGLQEQCWNSRTARHRYELAFLSPLQTVCSMPCTPQLLCLHAAFYQARR